MKRYATLVGGLLLCLVGLGFSVAYFVEAVYRRWGEADQSLLFWYLPFLFVGVFAVIFGVGLLLAGLRK